MKIQTGSRAHRLAALLAEKIPVPPGFIVASQAFDAFVEHNDLQTVVADALHKKSFDSPKDLKAISTQIRKKILSGEFPDDIAHQILSLYVKLGQPRVMLFPSISLEEKDLPSFAVLEDAFYGYKGDANLFQGIKELWSHFFDAQPLYYRLKHKKNHFTLPFAVTVQAVPQTKLSGVLYTDDLSSHTKQTVLVKVVQGEGAFVGELDGADYYWIKRGSGEVYKSSTDVQKTKIVFSDGEERREKLSALQSKKRKASQEVLGMLGKLAQKLQQHAFFPQHAIFSFDGKSIFLIDTKAAPTHERPHQTPSLTQPKIAKPTHTENDHHAPVILGLLHPLTVAAHAPGRSHIAGHLLLQPQYILSQFDETLSEQKKRLLTHEVQRTLSFSAQHCKADHGFIYTFPKIPNSPAHLEAQLNALQGIRQNFPLLPLLLVADTTGTMAYRLWVAQWNTHGFVRSSQIGHALLVSTPAGIHTLDENLEVGLDAIVVDVDQLDHYVHGGAISESEIQVTPALLEHVKRICTWSAQNGIQAIFSSKRPVDYAMLKTLAGDLSIEWITTEHTYNLITAQAAL